VNQWSISKYGPITKALSARQENGQCLGNRQRQWTKRKQYSSITRLSGLSAIRQHESANSSLRQLANSAEKFGREQSVAGPVLKPEA
jgi:hypothetical protein